MNSVVESGRFHLRFGLFSVREQFGDVRASLAANALIPFFVWLLSRLWERFNGSQGNFTLAEIVVYIGLTEVLYMTFVRPASVGRASCDFSIALARPRSWLVTSFSGLVGRSLGGRLFMLAILIPVFPLMGAESSHVGTSMLRLFLLLPWLALLQGLMALFFAIAQVLWHKTDYFFLPVGKVFLVLGGVWGPIADFNEPWRGWLLKFPPSDLFFQPAYFCIKGHFYGLSGTEWFLRTGLLALFLLIVNVFFFRIAKTRHQSFGG